MIIAKEKKELRRQVLTLRNQMSEKERAVKSNQILNRLYALDIYQSADIILTYVEYQSEVLTSPLINKALSENKLIFVPKVAEQNMEFYQINSLSDLLAGYKGIREPQTAEEPFITSRTHDQLNVLMLMPGAVFDKSHHRIGYGMGFYDRYLERLNASGISVYTAALCYECQILVKIPYDIHDIKPDMIITEQKIYEK